MDYKIENEIWAKRTNERAKEKKTETAHFKLK